MKPVPLPTIVTLASRRPGVWYLATPYSKHPSGLHVAFQDAAIIAGALLKSGLHVFSPIAHSHSIAQYGKLDATDHNIWMPLDLAMLEMCRGLIVAQMPGWFESYGVSKEIDAAVAGGKPVLYLRVDGLL